MNSKPVFVLIHGAWHSASTWEKVSRLLESADYKAVAMDLPGSGINAKQPASLDAQPFDPVVFASEPSPNAAVGQQERTAAVLEVVAKAAQAGNGKVILVGHSLGGLCVSSVTEAAPELVQAAVYLSGAMLPPEVPAITVMQHESMTDAMVAGLFVADPAQVGAMRVHTRSTDPTYLANVKETFYGDVDDSTLSAFLPSLHSDEPASVFVEPIQTTAERFGGVPRHYIRCLQDRTIPVAGQNYMIGQVDEAMGNETVVHDLNASHSPFLSQPEKLTAVLLAIASST